ncbi:hypothetical protein [Rhodoferax mekongensis]|uniref:hypothetical protein n=1 Tax=Rhodoferax mekongensis TaxID=3068341 RepID=UPI0028BD833C|nr:hypothetical protein [Rhodoferax sp. TBRC 17199]MDT7515371.1 hypothetical protein [Rhodoferax sp. TBRC 17199]
MQKNSMRSMSCKFENKHSFIVYRQPYIIEFIDYVIENYLVIFMSDLNSDLMFGESSALMCCVDMGLQNREELRKRNYENHPKSQIFSSYQSSKIKNLYCNLEAIDKLLPLLEGKGGLASMRDGTFDPRFDFKDSVQPMYPELKQKYLKCMTS